MGTPLTMDRQLRLDGSVDIPTDEEPLSRNADGSVPASHKKAAVWYAITHSLKVSAANAWPMYVFHVQQGNETRVHLKDILKEYADWRRAQSNKRQAGA